MDRNITVNVTKAELDFLSLDKNSPEYKDKILSMFMTAFNLQGNSCNFVKAEEDVANNKNIVTYKFSHNCMDFNFIIKSPLNTIDEGLIEHYDDQWK